MRSSGQSLIETLVAMAILCALSLGFLSIFFLSILKITAQRKLSETVLCQKALHLPSHPVDCFEEFRKWALQFPFVRSVRLQNTAAGLVARLEVVNRQLRIVSPQ